ncbi:MAG: GNAT family N-acetyltransferase, partial [Armatimonadetes bacterium]|nr:GNAT family N-acetyltransferase [Armatimonadota bacterium]
MSKHRLPQLSTERLVLRDLSEEDRAVIQTYWADERFLAFYPPDHLSPEHCDETIDEALAALAQHPRNGHHWAITIEGSTIGRIRLELSKRNSTGDIGYELAPDHWGNGYATEALREVVRYGFEELRLNRLQAWAYEPNKASQRVLEKAGFTHEGTM